MRRWLVAILLGLGVATASAETYPSRIITLVVPLAAGSATDAIARIVAQPLSEALGVRVVVENRVGASGMVGSSSVARAAPDGYTIMIGGTTTHSANPSLLKSINYDPIRDFEPLGRLGEFPYALLVSATLPAHSVRDVVALAKANPQAYSFGHGNAPGQLLGELLKKHGGIELNRIPYRGSPQAITDIIAGRTTMMFNDITAALSHVQAGTIRALAVTGDRRSALVPDLPSMRDEGFPGFDVKAWSGLFGPANLPPEVRTKLVRALADVLAPAEIRKRLADIGFEVLPQSPEELRRDMVADIERWRVLTKEAGIEPQ